jgi:hypothetical protein
MRLSPYVLDHTYVAHCFLNSTMNRPFRSPASKSHWNIPTLETNKNKNESKNKNKKQHSDACLHPCHSSSQTRQWSIRRKEFIKFHGNFSGKSFLSKQMYFLVSSFKTILTGQRSQHNWIHFQKKNLIIFFCVVEYCEKWAF